VVTAIAGGGDFSVALKSDGTLVAWGSNSWGQLNVPAGLSGVTAISACSTHGWYQGGWHGPLAGVTLLR